MVDGCLVPMWSLQGSFGSVSPSQSRVARRSVNLPASPTLVRTQHLPHEGKGPLTRPFFDFDPNPAVRGGDRQDPVEYGCSVPMASLETGLRRSGASRLDAFVRLLLAPIESLPSKAAAFAESDHGVLRGVAAGSAGSADESSDGGAVRDGPLPWSRIWRMRRSLCLVAAQTPRL